MRLRMQPTAKFMNSIRQSSRIILSTNHRERVMRPDIGYGLQAMVSR